MAANQRFEQAEAPRASQSAPVDWNRYDNSWSQEHNANNSRRQVGNSIIIEGDIYKTAAKPSTYGEALDALVNSDKGTKIAAIRSGDAQPYYSNSAQNNDQYSWHQKGRPSENPTAQGNTRFDAYSYYQNDQNSSVQPYRPIDMQPHSVPRAELVKDGNRTRPADGAPRAHENSRPACEPRQTYPCQPREMHPYQQRNCRPHHGGWYPGKIAGHVIGRVFGRHCR